VTEFEVRPVAYRVIEHPKKTKAPYWRDPADVRPSGYWANGTVVEVVDDWTHDKMILVRDINSLGGWVFKFHFQPETIWERL